MNDEFKSLEFCDLCLTSLTAIATQSNKNNILSIKQPYFHLLQQKGIKDV